MKWVTHQVGAFGAGLLLQLPLAGLAACVAGGILPDVFDQKLAGLFRNRQKAFNNIHRGFTHWPGLWLGLLVAVCHGWQDARDTVIRYMEGSYGHERVE